MRIGVTLHEGHIWHTINYNLLLICCWSGRTWPIGAVDSVGNYFSGKNQLCDRISLVTV